MNTRQIARFRRIIESIVPDHAGCLIWPLSLMTQGYGQYSLWGSSTGRMIGAHRLAWFLAHGPIPTGLQIDHLCRVRACVNIFHLRVVTPRLNTLSGRGPTALNALKTHCAKGHALIGQNLAVYPHEGRTKRVCRICSNANRRASFARHKERA